jgi:hypothetical protein
VREALGGIPTVESALALAAGASPPDEDLREAAALLQAAAKLRAEALSS